MYSLKKSLSLLLVAGMFIVLNAADKYDFKLSLDKKNAVYTKGDKIKLSLKYLLNRKAYTGPVSITVRTADWKEQTRIFDTAPAEFIYDTGKSPDAVQFIVTPLKADKKPVLMGKGKRVRPRTFKIGAAVDPQEFKTGSAEPEDFKKFWDDAKAELAKVPLKELERKELPVSNAKVGKVPSYFAFIIAAPMPFPKELEGKFKAWDVKVACVGVPVSGVLTIPTNAKPKSLPAIVSFNGAPGKSAKAAFADNVIRFDVNPHGFENGQPDAFYKNIHATKLKAYMFRGTNDRNKCYFLGMSLRAQRALDYVKSLPEYDGKTLIVVGNSQGGGQTLAVAGLDSDVKLIYVSVAAMCDHGGGLANRRPGWPRLLRTKNGKAVVPAVGKTAPYFDAAIFAKYIKAEAYLTVGLVDEVCAPASVFCAYNNIPGKKHLTILPYHGHSRTTSAEFNKRLLKVIEEAVKK